MLILGSLVGEVLHAPKCDQKKKKKTCGIGYQSLGFLIRKITWKVMIVIADKYSSLCARYCNKHLTSVNSFHPHTNPI